MDTHESLSDIVQLLRRRLNILAVVTLHCQDSSFIPKDYVTICAICNGIEQSGLHKATWDTSSHFSLKGPYF